MADITLLIILVVCLQSPVAFVLAENCTVHQEACNCKFDTASLYTILCTSRVDAAGDYFPSQEIASISDKYYTYKKTFS